MPDLPHTLYTPRTDTDSKFMSPAEVRIAIDTMVARVLKPVLKRNITVEQDPAGITLRIDY